MAVVSALPGLLAFLTALLAWLKSRQAVGVVAETRDNINELHLSINSKMDLLITAVTEAAHAKGMAEGLAQGVVTAQAAADKAELRDARQIPPPVVPGPVIVTGSPVKVTGSVEKLEKKEE